MANLKKPSPKKSGSTVELKGSVRKIPAGKNLGTTNLSEVIEVTVRLRRKNSIEDYVKSMQEGKNKVLSETEFEQRFAANEKDIEKVEAFAQENDLTVVQSSVARRSVILKGTVQDFSKAFGVFLADYQHNDGKI